MKKEYKKPYLLVESFQLNAAIAASCTSEGKTPINHGMNSCTAVEETPNLGFFGALCDDNVQVDGDGNDYYCYHGPVVDVTTLFMNS